MVVLTPLTTGGDQIGETVSAHYHQWEFLVSSSVLAWQFTHILRRADVVVGLLVV